jgi:hypothetical protein
VTDEDHVVQVLELKQLYDVVDVQLEIDRGAEQVRPLSQPGEGW